MSCGNCALTMIAMVLGWLLVASTLLWLTWNRVIATLTKVKPAKFWQALLLLTTVAVLCAPCAATKRGHHGCHDGTCPYDSKAVEKK